MAVLAVLASSLCKGLSASPEIVQTFVLLALWSVGSNGDAIIRDAETPAVPLDAEAEKKKSTESEATRCG